MQENDSVRPTWSFFEGAVSISVSMLLTVLLTECQTCDGTPVLRYLRVLTGRDDGVIVTATLMLFPTIITLYGGMIVIFAAKEFVEKRARDRGRRRGRAEGRVEGREEGREEGRVEGREEGRVEGCEEGRVEGRQAERERIQRGFEALGVPLTPEQIRILSDRSE